MIDCKNDIEDIKTPFSVLLSVYIKEQPSYLLESLSSVFRQTLKATEVVLVEDGPLTEDLYRILDEFKSKEPTLKTVPLEKNMGLGNAISVGLQHCSYELVIRMDTDDISYDNRFYEQVKFMIAHPEISVLSSSVDEFIDDPNKIISQRRLPETPQSLKKFAKYRSPINHPSAIFRKSDILKAGNYNDIPLFEDYFLWAKVLMNGGKLYCMQEPLLAFRMNRDTYKRRTGLDYVKKEIYLQKQLHKIGFTNIYELIRNLVLRVPPRLLSPKMISFVYRYVLRK